MRSDKVAGETSTQGHFVVTASVKRCDTKTQEGRYSSRWFIVQGHLLLHLLSALLKLLHWS